MRKEPVVIRNAVAANASIAEREGGNFVRE
jgi:hypothetical protein